MGPVNARITLGGRSSLEAGALQDSDPPATNGALLSVRDLEVRIPTQHGTIHPVNAVSFELGHGEVVGIIGESGSGKSTLARALVGLLPANAQITGGAAELHSKSGTLDLLRQDGASMRRIRGATVGFVPQSTTGALNPVVPLGRQFMTTLRAHRNLSRRECKALALEMLQIVGIGEPERVLAGHASELSGGMAQRVAIAMVLALHPTLLIADEPTTGLDVTVQKQILDELRRLTMATGTSLVLVTHDMGVVAQYCQSVIVLYGGFALEAGPVEQVLSRPAHPYTRLLLGAIPRRGKPLRVIAGSVGDLRTVPEGCAFYHRCPSRSDPKCATTRPPMRAVSSDHYVATFCMSEEGS